MAAIWCRKFQSTAEKDGNHTHHLCSVVDCLALPDVQVVGRGQPVKMIYRFEVPKISITDEMREQALVDEKVLSENYGSKTMPLSPRRDYIGSLGEQVFRKFLIESGLKENVDFIYDRTKSGKFGDKYDFLFLKTNKTVDVKATYGHFDLYVKVDRFKKSPVDYYVLVNIWQKFDFGEILGFATKQQILNRKPRTIIVEDFVVLQRHFQNPMFLVKRSNYR